MDLGNKIKNLREIEKISQEQLAKTLKINRNYLSRIETGKSEPTSSILKDLANIFNIKLASTFLLINIGNISSDVAK